MNPEHLKIINQGVRAWNKWIKENDYDANPYSDDGSNKLAQKPDLSGANLSGKDLQRVDFKHTDLTGVNFSKSDLRKADFALSNITGVDFTGADLRGSNLTFLSVDGTEQFTGAKLSGAELGAIDCQLKILEPERLRNLPKYWAKWKQNMMSTSIDKTKAEQGIREVCSRAGFYPPDTMVWVTNPMVFLLSFLILKSPLLQSGEKPALELARLAKTVRKNDAIRETPTQEIADVVECLYQVISKGSTLPKTGKVFLEGGGCTIFYGYTNPLLSQLNLPEGILEHLIGDPPLDTSDRDLKAIDEQFFDKIDVVLNGRDEFNALAQFRHLALLDCLLTEERGSCRDLKPYEDIYLNGVWESWIFKNVCMVLSKPKDIRVREEGYFLKEDFSWTLEDGSCAGTIQETLVGHDDLASYLRIK